MKRIKNNVNVIPYDKCYEDMGIIENHANSYSIAFRIFNDKSVVSSIDTELVYMAMNHLIKGLSNVRFQFLIRNVPIDVSDYLDSIKLEKNRDSKTNEIIDKYNDVLTKNVDVGHNNYRTEVVLTIELKADSLIEAKAVFQELEKVVIEAIEEIPGFKAKLMELAERLSTIFDIYHSDLAESFDKDLINNVPNKELVAPEVYDRSHRNYLLIGNQYVRLFFINNISSENTDTILNDLISVSNNSMLSVIYQPLDPLIGYSAAKRFIQKNTETTEVQLRRTIEERKLRKTKTVESVIDECESDNFIRQTMPFMKDCALRDEAIIQSTFIIGVYANSLDELDRDTKLLQISASKYSCQVKTCDYVQHEAFQSMLPLGVCKIDASRVFGAGRISRILPFNINTPKAARPMLEGLNAINDNLILIDRTKEMSELIVGSPKTGKTYELKREIVNMLMASDSTLVVLTSKTHKFETLARELECRVFNQISPDLFEKDTDYGLGMDNKKARGIFLEAFVTAKNGFYKRRLLKDEQKQLYNTIEQDVGMINEMPDYQMALDYLDLNPKRCESFRKAISDYKPDKDGPMLENSRVNIIEIADFSGFVTTLDYVWNYAIKMKKSNRNICIYLDGIDEFLESETTSDYLISIIDRCEKLNVPVSMVMDELVQTISDEDSAIELDYLLKKVNMFKILSAGPIERKYLEEKLTIPKILMPYITDREPKEGIIISQSFNIAFNDHFESTDEPFFRLFN